MFEKPIRPIALVCIVALVAVGGFAAPVAAECDAKYNPCPDTPGEDAPNPDEHFPDSAFDEHFPGDGRGSFDGTMPIEDIFGK